MGFKDEKPPTLDEVLKRGEVIRMTPDCIEPEYCAFCARETRGVRTWLICDCPLDETGQVDCTCGLELLVCEPCHAQGRDALAALIPLY